MSEERDAIRRKFMQYGIEHPLVKSSTQHIKALKKRRSATSSPACETKDIEDHSVEELVEEKEQNVFTSSEEETQEETQEQTKEQTKEQTQEQKESMIEVNDVKVTVVEGENTCHGEVELQIENNGKEVVEEEKVEEEAEEEMMNFVEKAKKAGVAVSGGALVVVGIPFIPFPAPIGCAMIAGGLSVLATEFPAAQRVIDVSKNKLREFAEYGENAMMLEDSVEEQKEQNIEETNEPKYGAKESLRNLAKNQLLPLLDRFSSRNQIDVDGEKKNVDDVDEIFV